MKKDIKYKKVLSLNNNTLKYEMIFIEDTYEKDVLYVKKLAKIYSESFVREICKEKKLNFDVLFLN